MTRGTIVWVDLSDATAPEMGKRRPAVIVSNSVQNLALDSVVGIPLSSQAPEIPPLRIRVRPTGARAPSYAIVPGIRQLKKTRILRVAGRLSASDMASVDKATLEYLSD